ncbi:MAG TPA: bifunctional [glutamine synthetase] adenylyltransferase/[glutamine synthetase]-adenylyl-L-tyrosine phosphorylase [Actinomycetota bacterium]|nr:bifunctional [glutamine synthetase] adenylyltransferase/[glutamine synthetase]-adenylyl-L-tyrosine phosphorylase [Actinomycetota bacterium]
MTDLSPRISSISQESPPAASQPERRRAAVTAASRTLAELLETDPEGEAFLAGPRDLPTPGETRARLTRAYTAGGIAALKAAKRKEVLGIAARDLAGEVPVDAVGRSLADVADICLDLVASATPGLGVVAMGKLGARELNYYSDIDIMFVVDEISDDVVRAAERLLRELGGGGAEGQAFIIDVDLRPEGRSGPLVRSLESFLEYYRRWCEPWELQALIKARAAAGARRPAEALVEATRPLVFATDVSADRVAAIRKMKERVEQHAMKSARKSRTYESYDVKLGPGGIRDIEFAVQLLQLVHGGSDESVRDPATLDALAALVEGGYVADDDGAGLDVAYRWLRTVEHRLQLWQERRVRHLPRDHGDLTRLARVLGFMDSPAASAAERFDQAHAGVLRDVRSRFEKLFYRPMVEALADPSGPRLSRQAVVERLRVLGFRDTERAARTLEGLVSGTSRRAKLFGVLSPAFMRFIAATPLPDAGLFAFLRLGEAMGSRLDVFGALRDNPAGLELLARVLGSGRFLGEMLEQVPEELTLIADTGGAPDRGPSLLKDREQLMHEAFATLEWRVPERRLDGLRRFKRREVLRLAVAELAGVLPSESVGAHLADLADSCLEAALPADVPFAVIAMGKLGGRELGYSSDLDVMFVHRMEPADAERLAEELLRSIGEVTPEGQTFRIDPALRPEGKSGPLTRTLKSYVEYYARWAEPWEHQALIKRRLAAGLKDLGDEFVAATNHFAFPSELPDSWRQQIRHLKARMERERIPRRTDPRRNLKLGPGGLSDVEFATQLLQLEYGHRWPELQTSNTLDALRAAAKLELIADDARERLEAAFVFLSRLRDRLHFLTGRPAEMLPDKPEELEALGVALGYRDQPRQQVEEEYLRITRRARKVAEPLIYGD